MSDSIGTFSAPGAGVVDVLGIELTHDFDSGTLEGVARLSKRPYWEGTLTPCVIEMPATHDRAAQSMTGFWVGRGVYDGEGCNVNIAGMKVQPIPATPTLDEPTAPADVDWSEIRSATEARDWRRAWQAVGTDHTGDATPGETYLLSKAARAKATAAALVAWRKVEMDAGTIFIGADAARVWERIKRIAGWTSQARAQYDERGNRRGRLQAALRDGLSRATQIPARVLFGDPLTGQRVNVGVIDDPVDPELYGNGSVVVRALNNPFLSAIANRGEITGAMTFRQDGDQLIARYGVTAEASITNPPSTSRSIAAMLATQARLTGGARLNVGTEDESITITPSSENAADFMARGGPVGAIATHATNPNPRGPQPRRRSRT